MSKIKYDNCPNNSSAPGQKKLKWHKTALMWRATPQTGCFNQQVSPGAAVGPDCREGDALTTVIQWFFHWPNVEGQLVCHMKWMEEICLKREYKIFTFGWLLSCPAPAKLGHPGARPARRTEMISKPAKQARNAGKKLRIIIDWRNFLTCRISNFSITQYKIIIYAGRERAATHLLAMLVRQLAASRDTNKQTRRAGEPTGEIHQLVQCSIAFKFIIWPTETCHLHILTLLHCIDVCQRDVSQQQMEATALQDCWNAAGIAGSLHCSLPGTAHSHTQLCLSQHPQKR